jgi:hypothetical protein
MPTAVTSPRSETPREGWQAAFRDSRTCGASQSQFGDLTCASVRGEASRRLSGCRVLSASLVYLVMRQVLQILTQLARDDGAKDVELLVLRLKIP